jgi:hypothetical protein
MSVLKLMCRREFWLLLVGSAVLPRRRPDTEL